jgi:hypothetical protein
MCWGRSWSNNAFYACTRIFASCLQDAMAQRFYNLVLLPRVVEDLKFNKRLNYHLYQASPATPTRPAPSDRDFAAFLRPGARAGPRCARAGPARASLGCCPARLAQQAVQLARLLSSWFAARFAARGGRAAWLDEELRGSRQLGMCCAAGCFTRAARWLPHACLDALLKAGAMLLLFSSLQAR